MTSTSGWIDPAPYPFTRTLEADYKTILAEVEHLIAQQVWSVWGAAHYARRIETMTMDDIRAALDSRQTSIGEDAEAGWRVFALQLMRRPFERNCRLCPRTAEILAGIPNLTTAAFTCMEAGYRTPVHTGTFPVYRAHLGLIVPDGDCGLRVDDEARTWEPGKVLMFDDTHQHEAWNLTGAHRYILIVDAAP